MPAWTDGTRKSESQPAPSSFPQIIHISKQQILFFIATICSSVHNKGMVGLSKILFIALLIISLGSQVKSEASNHHYNNGDRVLIYANKVGPHSNPGETFAYYDFSFCSPDAVKEKANAGMKLNGNHLVLTPYKLEFLVNKQFEVLCKKTLSKTDVSQFRSVIAKDYHMEFYHDNLPISTFVGRVESDHTNDQIKSKYFLYNHYDFEVFYNKDRVIEVLLQVDPIFMVEVTEDKEVDVAFTYSVRWLLTKHSFDERMEKDIGSLVLPPNMSVHGYSIANSCFTILILLICLLIFYIRVLRKDISRYACDVEEAGLADNQEETGWKNIHGDVFRFPKHKSLFAAALGSGTQLLLLTVAVLILGVTGVFQPYHPRVFLNTLLIVYAFTSAVSGYTSVSFYSQLEGTSWKKNLFLSGGLYFVPLFLTVAFNNAVAIFTGSSAALASGDILTSSLLLVLLAFPLLLFGAVVGKHGASDFKAPCRTAKCPREVPRLRWYKSILPQMVLAGLLPFSIINIQLHDILSTVWGHGIYTFYNSMSIVFFLLLIITPLVSVALTYFQLAVENHKWWWRSFFCGGSTGLYMYAYSIYYYFCLSDLNNFTQAASFFGYMACLSYGIFLVLGTVGFHASLRFVRYLYASIKCD